MSLASRVMGLTSIFSGLISRCMMPIRCMQLNPLITWQEMKVISSSVRLRRRFFLVSLQKVMRSQGMNSNTRQVQVLSRRMWSRRIILGCCSFCRMRISLCTTILIQGAVWLIFLMATSAWVRQSVARMTTLQAPCPICSFILNLSIDFGYLSLQIKGSHWALAQQYNNPMVKFSNKAKGKPTKRKTLKTKYKIERKVKQHRKKIRKEARKLGQKGIKPRRNQETNALPNSFPFKNQILQHFKSQRAAPEGSPTQDLVTTEWGLLAIEPRLTYFPKDKDHLTKKYITNEAKIWEHANVIIEVLDARNPQACIHEQFRAACTAKGIPRITVISKIDTVNQKSLKQLIESLQSRGDKVISFTTESKRKNQSIEGLIQAIEALGEGLKKCVVVGKANTGKHTIIKLLMKLAKFHNEDYATLSDVEIWEGIHLVDAPYKLEDNSEYPLFHPPSTLLEESLMAQEQKVLKYLFFTNLKNRDQTLIHFSIQDFNSLDDLLKKIGKSSRTFGKGGMVDVAGVRSNILKAWYSGKINHLFD